MIEIDTTESEHAVDEGGFTVIDVSNNGDVSDFLEEFFLRFGKLTNLGEWGEGFSEKIRGEGVVFFGEGVEESS